MILRCILLGKNLWSWWKSSERSLKGKGHIIIMNNYFSSVDLLEDLSDNDISVVATAHSDRKKWPAELNLQGDFFNKALSMALLQCAFLVEKRQNYYCRYPF